MMADTDSGETRRDAALLETALLELSQKALTVTQRKLAAAQAELDVMRGRVELLLERIDGAQGELSRLWLRDAVAGLLAPVGGANGHHGRD